MCKRSLKPGGYEVRVPANIKRKLKKIPRRYYKSVVEALLDLNDDPFLGKRLRDELKGKFSYGVGSYRLVYKIDEKKKLVAVTGFDHRGRIYN